MLNDKINVINVGTDVFANAVKEQGIPAEQLNWKPAKRRFCPKGRKKFSKRQCILILRKK